MDKGQHLRLFIDLGGGQIPVIALATDLTMTVTASVESSTTKDTTTDWAENEVTGISYEFSTTAVLASGTDDKGLLIANLLNDVKNDQKLSWRLEVAGGTNNRVSSATIATGGGYITNLAIEASAGQIAKYSITIKGKSQYSVLSA